MSGQIVLPLMRDQTDQLIQGEQWDLLPFDPTQEGLFNFVQNDMLVIGQMNEIPIPRTYLQTPWEGLGINPRKMGPMVMDSGEVVMFQVGTPPAPNYGVDPIQIWLNTPIPYDATGNWYFLGAPMPGALEAVTDMILPTDTSLDPDPSINIPRLAILRSGLLKRFNTPTLPDSFGVHLMMDMFTDSTQKYTITGVTKDSTGTPLGGCTVLLVLTDRFLYEPAAITNCVMASTVSDGSGNFSFQVGRIGPWQLIAYKATGPDVAGVTVNTVVPVLGS